MKHIIRATMGNWRSVTLAFSECRPGGKGKALEIGFENLYRDNGSPEKAGLWSKRDKQKELDPGFVIYYF
ncbi:MAG TPA: hypothetical protein VFE61_01530, partial [Candidatus Sulfotelmatobacter sp.]|nr:hypothetical protein [Candidatus Sulfotelmatobacter sp.]